jgi:hypothetical protein
VLRRPAGRNGGAERRAAAALRLLARHPDGCAEAVLLAHGFSYDQLGDLVFDRRAMMQPTVTYVGGREKIVVWVQITPARRKAIAE